MLAVAVASIAQCCRLEHFRLEHFRPNRIHANKVFSSRRHAAPQQDEADLINMWHVLVEVIQAACQGEDGHSNEEDPCEAPHPRAVV